MKLRNFLLGMILTAGALLLPAQDKRPVISFDSQTKDVGKVTEGETIKHIFRFTNKGEATLEIFKVEPS